MEIYETLCNHGPLTTNEIFEKLFGTSTINNPSVHSRLCELRELGCVVEVGKKECRLTKMTVILWDSTTNMPVEIPKKERIQKQIGKLETRLAKLQKQLLDA